MSCDILKELYLEEDTCLKINFTKLQDCASMASIHQDINDNPYGCCISSLFDSGKKKLSDNGKIIIFRKYQEKSEEELKVIKDLKEFIEFEKNFLDSYKIIN